MAHSPVFDRFARAMRLAIACEREGISTAEGLERAAESEARRASRRAFLADLGKLAVAGAVAGVAGAGTAFAGPAPAIDVAIVGAGLAGLACADELKRAGVIAKLYEAETSRVGGRCWSSSAFPGQVFERGGELIDNWHKTMLGYVQRFKLTKELQWRTFEGHETFYFGGQFYTEAQIVDEYRAFVAAMRDDLRGASSEVTADDFTSFDAQLDHTTLEAYLNGGGPTGVACGPIARASIGAAYLAEYGRDLRQQSALNFLFFAKASRQSKYEPFGNSDERYHVLEGNDRIVAGLRGSLNAGQIQPGMKLTAISRTSGGRVQLTFNGKTVKTHDAVVLAIPFTLLREVNIAPNLFPDWKMKAIRELGYGDNAKTMVRFNGRPWAASGGNGVAYSDLQNHQTTWETNPANATASRAILTDYASAARGRALTQSNLQGQVDAFLTDLNKVFPGAKAAATKSSGKYVAHLEAWPSNPFAKGSYTCYLPGQFTTIAGNEGKAVGNVFFAGEHTDSFYLYQGFLEGAANSGILAASQVLAK